jgi:hypothetical protein
MELVPDTFSAPIGDFKDKNGFFMVLRYLKSDTTNIVMAGSMTIASFVGESFQKPLGICTLAMRRRITITGCAKTASTILVRCLIGKFRQVLKSKATASG